MANDIDNKGRSHKSYSVVIPFTPTNNTTLSGLFTQKISRTIRFEATFDVGDFTMYGYLLINNIERNSARGVFISGNGKLWTELDETNLRDFAWSAYDVDYTLANVNASNTGGDVVFDVSDRGRFMADYDLEGGQLKAAIDITERYPAVKLGTILSEICTQQAIGLNWLGAADKIIEIRDEVYLLFTQDRNIQNDKDWLTNSIMEAADADLQFQENTLGAGAFDWIEDIELTEVTDPGSNYGTSTHLLPPQGQYGSCRRSVA
jgi:hypothetical protein